jgi:hypothetical protein
MSPPFHDISFAFVTFVNHKYPYPQLMNITLESHRLFSKVPLILYTHTIDPEFFEPRENVFIVEIDPDTDVNCIFTFKPWVITDAVHRGLKAGYYIEADDILSPWCDSVQSYLSRVTTIPISPIHVHGSTPPLPLEYIQQVGATEETQPYCHGHVLFRRECQPFLEEWLACTQRINGFNWDESVLNALYWKYKCKGHFLPIIDPGQGFFTHPYFGPECQSQEIVTPITYHGSKDIVECQQFLATVAASQKC